MRDVGRSSSTVERFARTLPVLGIETRFETNDEDIMSAVDDAFGGWSVLDATSIDPGPGVRVRITLEAGAFTDTERSTVRHSCPDATRVFAHSTQCIGLSDPARGDATAIVGPTLVADRAYFREMVLEALTFALLSHFDRHPIHAAGVARDGRTVLLFGPSGAGKSTLAHVAHAAGLTVLNDDHVWIQRSPRFRVWGAPGRARLLPFDVPADSAQDDLKNAKRIVELDGARWNPDAYAADSTTVCILTRGSAAALERADRASIVRALVEEVDPGFDRFPERHAAVAEQLAAGGGWRLTLTNDPHDALPLLRRMLDT